MPTQLPLNPTPEQEYQTNEVSCKKLRDLLANPALREAFSVSLLQYQRELTAPLVADGNAAAASFLKLKGAQDFIQILIDLPYPKVAPMLKSDPSKLNHRA